MLAWYHARRALTLHHTSFGIGLSVNTTLQQHRNRTYSLKTALKSSAYLTRSCLSICMQRKQPRPASYDIVLGPAVLLRLRRARRWIEPLLNTLTVSKNLRDRRGVPLTTYPLVGRWRNPFFRKNSPVSVWINVACFLEGALIARLKTLMVDRVLRTICIEELLGRHTDEDE
jgi:hypothetical protein